MKDRVLWITLVLLIMLCAGFLFWILAGAAGPGPKPIDEAEAIELIKTAYPELRDYPSDSLPPRSIRTERSDQGWCIAFIQEGSGRPIISATCYCVDNTGTIMSIRTYTPNTIEDPSAVFSAITCTPGACSLETCHGLNITCGANPPDVCTAMYMIGDRCLQYARCGVRDGTCQTLETAEFTRCKSCVQDCVSRYSDTSEKLFLCESMC